MEYMTEIFNEDIARRVQAGLCKDAYVAKGWRPMVIELNEKLRAIDPSYRIDQIKEKFGGLRYYVAFCDDCSLDDAKKMNDLIEQAEENSYEVCQTCGAAGRMRVTKGYLHAECDACLESFGFPVREG